VDAKKTGKSIAFLRKQYGLTQKELADRLGVTDKAVSKWERGMGGPDISLLTKLAMALDVDIESILEGNLTHLGLKWKGILVMDYPEGIYADSLLYDKPVVYLQLSFFLLSGIRDIMIYGKGRDVEFLKSNIGDGSVLGVNIKYSVTDDIHNLNKERPILFEIKGINIENGVFLINGLDFIYGKDLTRTFRRLIYDSRDNVKLRSPSGKDISIGFYPSGLNSGLKKIHLMLERGTIAFPIGSKTDLLDASILTRILEERSGEQIADLRSIARLRGLISGD